MTSLDNARYVAFKIDRSVFEREGALEDYGNFMINESFHARCFSEGVAANEVVPNTTIKTVFSLDPASNSPKKLFTFGKDKRKSEDGPLTLLVFRKNIPELVVEVDLITGQGNPITVTVSAKVTVAPERCSELLILLCQPLALHGGLIAQDAKKYGLSALAEEDIRNVFLGPHIQRFLASSLVNYSEDEIKERRGELQEYLFGLLDNEGPYWLNKFGFLVDITNVCLGSTRKEMLMKDEENASFVQQLERSKEENRHILETQRIKNQKEESEARLELENKVHRSKLEMLKRESELEIELSDIRNEKKEQLFKKMNQLREIDRQNEVQYRKKLLEIEKMNLQVEGKISKAKQAHIEKLADAIKSVCDEPLPEKVFCPMCHIELLQPDHCEVCGFRVCIEQNPVSETAATMEEEARNLRDLLIFNKKKESADADAEETDPDTAYQTIAKALLKNQKKFSIVNVNGDVNEFLIGSYTALFRENGRVMICNGSTSTLFHKNGIMFSEVVFIICVDGMVHIYFEEPGYVKVNGANVNETMFNPVVETSEISIAGGFYTFRIQSRN